MANFRRRFPEKRKVVNRHWTRAAGSFLAQGAGTAALTFSAAQHLRETCIRMRGELSCWGDGALVTGSAAIIAVGVILVPQGSGGTVLWSPTSDSDAPWLFYQSFMMAYEEAVTDVIDIPVMSGFRSVVDNKAMRIVRPDVEMQLVVENTTIGGAMTVNVHMEARILSQQ